MFDELDVLAASAATIVLMSAVSVAIQRARRRRRFWIRPSLVARRKYSTTDFMRDLVLDDTDLLSLEYRSGAGFKNFFRMSTTEFENILQMIAPKISRMDTKFRKAIPVHERLACALRFFATGDSYHSLQYNFKISKQLISKIIPEVCDAIVDALRDYIKVSNTSHTVIIIEYE